MRSIQRFSLIPPMAGYGSLTGPSSALFDRSNSIPKRANTFADDQPRNIAIDCEATAMMYRDGWYYLLGDHGTCCSGANSTYNIVVGRSKKVTGPFVDNMGIDMLQGGGKLVVAASGRFVGPGHFGLTRLG